MLDEYNNKKVNLSKAEAAEFEKAYDGRKDPNMTFFDDSNMSTTMQNLPKLPTIPY